MRGGGSFGRGPGSGFGQGEGGSARAGRPPRGPSALSTTVTPLGRAKMAAEAAHAGLDRARAAVLERVTAEARRYPQIGLEPLDESGLDARDAAFAHAVYDATVRRWLTLEFLVGLYLKEPMDRLDPRLKSALMVGAAQLLFLDRVPPHAAVHSSVAYAKNGGRPKAFNMVNAVLRRVASLVLPAAAAMVDNERGERVEAAATIPTPAKREKYTDRRDEIPLDDGRALALTEEVMPEDPMQRLAVATSHPIGLLRMWMRTMPLREVRALAMHGLSRPPTILNTAAMTGEALPPGLAAPHSAPGHHVFTGSHADLVALLRRGDLWAQDPASSLAVESVVDLRPGLVLDVCAGRGTKTRQLASVFPEARIVATDVNAERRRDLARAFAGHSRVEVIEPRGLEEFVGKADLVLIDAPCSNTGVLARRVEARYRVSEDSIRDLVSTQKQIIADSVRLLAMGGKDASGASRQRGRILYSTCSLDPEENEALAKWADRWHGLSPSRERRRAPSGGPGQPPEAYTDGSYAVLLG